MFFAFPSTRNFQPLFTLLRCLCLTMFKKMNFKWNQGGSEWCNEKEPISMTFIVFRLFIFGMKFWIFSWNVFWKGVTVEIIQATGVFQKFVIQAWCCQFTEWQRLKLQIKLSGLSLVFLWRSIFWKISFFNEKSSTVTFRRLFARKNLSRLNERRLGKWKIPRTSSRLGAFCNFLDRNHPLQFYSIQVRLKS